MKRVDLIRRLEEAGCVLVRNGGNHDWYRNLKTGASQRCAETSRDQGFPSQAHPEKAHGLRATTAG